MRRADRVITFIDTAVNAAKAVDGARTEFRLRDAKGYPMDRLVLEVQPSENGEKKARRVWRVHYDWPEGGRRLRRKIKIGDGATPLVLIRERWREIKDAVDDGRDWATEQEEALRRAEEEKRKILTFADVAALYMARHSKAKKRTWQDDERKLDKYILPAIGAMPAKSVRKTDVIAIIDAVAYNEDGSDRSLVQADRVKALVSSIFNWACAEAKLDHNPAERILARSEKNRRERIFLHKEIRDIWADVAKPSTGATEQAAMVVRLGFLTVQRLGVITSARRREVDLSPERPTWRIPSKRTKNKTPHAVPLTPVAAALFAEAIETWGGNSPYVFASLTKEGVPLHRDTASHAFGALCAKLNICSEDDGDDEEEEGIDFHSIRHTVKTEMGRMGVLPHVSEMILHHKNPTASMETLYDHADYDGPKRQALCAWETRLLGIVGEWGPPISNKEDSGDQGD
jgi:integrase